MAMIRRVYDSITGGNGPRSRPPRSLEVHGFECQAKPKPTKTPKQ